MTDQPNTYTMEALAKALDGRLDGDAGYKVVRTVHPADECKSGDLALAMEPGLLPLLKQSKAEVAIVGEGAEVPANLKATIFVGRSRYAMSKLTALFEKKLPACDGIHPSAFVEEGAEIAEGVSIGAFSYVAAGAVIGANTVIHPQSYIGPDAQIGPNGLIYPGVRIGARVIIGARSIIHYNTTIGADGFSFVTPEVGSVEAAKTTGEVGSSTNTQLVRIASLGAVVLGDDVEVGANTSIDRGTIVSTCIGNGTKIDNQVQIGHNVKVGDHCLLCGRVGIAGSTVIGDRVVLGGGVGVADHVKVGDDVVAMAMSGIAGHVHPKTVIGGVPAKPRKKFMEDIKNIARVKFLSAKIKTVMERLDALEKNDKPTS